MKVTFITRTLSVLAILLCCGIVPGNAVLIGQQPVASHTVSTGQSEAKVGSAVHIQPLRPGFQFPYGQTFRYVGEWRFWSAGTVTLRIDHSGPQDHVSVTADSTGVVAMLYRVQDRFNSYFDARTLCSYKLIKHTEEGSHRRETNITYDYNRGKAVLAERNLRDNQQKNQENDIPGCVTDVVSGILYLASLPLQVGTTYTFPLNDGGNTATVQAHVEGKEQIKTPAGTFQTIRVSPEGDSGILKNKGRFWIWYTDDDRHLPIQIRAKLFWGILTVYLANISK